MKLAVSSSPHIRGKWTTTNIMRDVIIALLPAVLCGVYFYGTRALGILVVSVAACVAGEFLFRMVTKQYQTVTDLSAVVTGLLIGLTVPATVPYWVVALGGLFAVVVVKGLCGGLGKNIFNPALSARAMMLLVYPAWLTRYAASGTKLSLFDSPVDMVTAATPLHHMQMPAIPETPIAELFLGHAAGCIGEASGLALLLGGLYLIVRKVISPRIPVSYLATVAVITLIFSKGETPISWMLYSLVSGGILLGVFFMATDYSTSPVTPKGQVIFGIGCGILTVLFRYNGLYPEGFTYAILLMNALVWVIDRYTMPKRFGTVKEVK